MFKLADLFVEIGAKTGPLDSVLSSVKGRLSALGSMRFNVPLGGGILSMLGGGAVIAGLKHAVDSASDLNESMDAMRIIMGDAAPAVVEFAKDMADQFGIVKKESVEAASGIGAMAKGLGDLRGKELAELTKKLTVKAFDFSSMKNLSVPDATSAIVTTLKGDQSDEMIKAGVVINETTMKLYALRNGIKAVGGAFTESQKFMMRSDMIMKGLVDSTDNLKNTFGGFANQQRAAAGKIENAFVALGQVFQDSAIKMQGLIGIIAVELTEGIETGNSSIQSWAKEFEDAFGTIGILFSSRVPIWGKYVLEFNHVLEMSSLGIGVWRDKFIDALNSMKPRLESFSIVTLKAFGDMEKNWMAMWGRKVPQPNGGKIERPDKPEKPLFNADAVGLKALAVEAKFVTEMAKLDDQINKIAEKHNPFKPLGQGPAPIKDRPPEADIKDRPPEADIKKAPAAQFLGGAEYSRHIQKSILEGANVPKQQLAEQKKANVFLDEIAKKMIGNVKLPIARFQ